MPVPRLVDAGVSNGFRWMLMDRLFGVNMNTIYCQLPSQQACSIAKQIAHVFYDLSQISFRGCGALINKKQPESGLTIGRPFV